MHNQDSLSFQVLRAKYFICANPWSVSCVPNSSFLWKSLLEGLKVVLASGFWQVGTVLEIDGWNNVWIPYLNGKTTEDVLQLNHIPLRVSKLIDEDTRQWRQ